MTNTPMTVGDVRKVIKDLPDDMPIAIQADTEPDYMHVMSIYPKSLTLSKEYNDLDEEVEIETLCFDFE